MAICPTKRRFSRVAAAHFGSLNFKQTLAYLRFSIREQNARRHFSPRSTLFDSQIEVISLGKRFEIVKQIGSPANLERAFPISNFQSSHGRGHARLSTESIYLAARLQPGGTLEDNLSEWCWTSMDVSAVSRQVSRSSDFFATLLH